MTEVVVTTGAIRCAKLKSNHHYQQTNTQLFTGRMSFLSPNQQCQSMEGRDANTLSPLISYTYPGSHKPTYEVERYISTGAVFTRMTNDAYMSQKESDLVVRETTLLTYYTAR